MERPTAAAFPLTRWSMVLQLRHDGETEQSRAALEELCRQYWFPLYAFARRRGQSPADAEDLTQSFFAELIDAKLFESADPAQGRLRTFLLAAFQRRLADQHRREHALKRGGGQPLVSIDLDLAEDRFRAELADHETPESVFELRWAVALLDAAMGSLEQEYVEAGKRPQFDALRPFLTAAQAHATGYEELAGQLKLSVVATRQSVHRLRERFRQILRQHVADTLREPTPAAVDEELAALKSALTRSGI
jgi:RNA polymerase sigma factor (sigma-70 family)